MLFFLSIFLFSLVRDDNERKLLAELREYSRQQRMKRSQFYSEHYASLCALIQRESQLVLGVLHRYAFKYRKFFCKTQERNSLGSDFSRVNFSISDGASFGIFYTSMLFFLFLSLSSRSKGHSSEIKCCWSDNFHFFCALLASFCFRWKSFDFKCTHRISFPRTKSNGPFRIHKNRDSHLIQSPPFCNCSVCIFIYCYLAETRFHVGVAYRPTKSTI